MRETETERDRQRERERERERELALEDFNTQGYIALGPLDLSNSHSLLYYKHKCYTTNTNKHDNTTKTQYYKRERTDRTGRQAGQTNRETETEKETEIERDREKGKKRDDLLTGTLS